MNSHLKILIVDDEPELRRSVSAVLQSTFTDLALSVDEAGDGLEALQKYKGEEYDLVIMDVRMPNIDGLEALRLMKEHDPKTFVVIMTAHSNLQDAVSAIRDGAYDYLEKPINTKKLSDIVQKALDARKIVSDLAISNPIFDDDVESEFVGSSKKMTEVFGLIYKLCKVDTTVLIRGENGTGKELVARAIHLNSPRKSGQFVAINCGAIPENLIESELFGHEKGAFTGAVERKIGKFQLASNGTLFLDELGELKPELQVKLLRVVQERVFTPVGGNREVKTNARIIAATNRNLEKMMQEGAFREDLFYRLNVMPIFLPPLRERKEDISALAMHFVKRFSKIHGKEFRGIDQATLEAMKSYPWPGNIRELENVIERAFIVENSETITVQSLPEAIQASSANTSMAQTKAVVSRSEKEVNLDFELFKEESEKEFIVQALKANKGKINQTVATANIPKNTLLRKIKKFGINPEDYK